MKLPAVSSCCCLLNLRMGTILIAITQLLLSGFCMFLLLLCSGHAQEMAGVLEADIDEEAEREGITLSEDDVADEYIVMSSSSASLNEVRLHQAKYLVTVIVTFILIGIFFFLVSFIASAMLLIGCIIQNRILVFPWLCVNVLSIIFCQCWLLAVMFGFDIPQPLHRFFFVHILYLILIGFMGYTLLVVHSYYLLLKSRGNSQPWNTIAIKPDNMAIDACDV